MVNKAIVINNNFIVAGSLKEMVSGLEEFTLSAVAVCAIKASKEQVKGGTIFVSNYPSPACAKVIVGMGLKKLIVPVEAVMQEEIMAEQFMIENGIEIVTNKEIKL